MIGVIYARYSSDSQREESIEGQLRECYAFAEREGISIFDTYIDRALSAKTDNRPQFQKMIKDSSKQKFDVVIVWKLDRFARNRFDSAHYKNVLKKNKVRVISATENISEGSEGILLESVLEGMAEYYSAELAEKVGRGMTENALKCKFNGGTVPIGYTINKDQFFEVDPVKAPYVVQAFEAYANGKTIKEIVDILNAKGLTTSLGSKITINIVTDMLKNRRYIGEYKFRDIVQKDGIPRIVPQALFDKVQIEREKNKRATARHKAEDDYLLTTKLFCGKCGRYMTGESGTGRSGAVHRYYKCNGAKYKHTCDKKTVKKDWIESIVIKYTREMMMSDNVLEDIAGIVFRNFQKENPVIQLLKQRLSEAETALNNLLKAIEEGIITSTTKQRMLELEQTRDEINLKLIKEEMKKPTITKEGLRLWLKQIQTMSLETKEHKQRLIDCFVNAVYLYDDKLVITFNYKEASKTVTLEQVNGSIIECSGAPYRVFITDLAVVDTRFFLIVPYIFDIMKMKGSDRMRKNLVKSVCVIILTVLILCSGCTAVLQELENAEVRQSTEGMLDALIANDFQTAYSLVDKICAEEDFKPAFTQMQELLGNVDTYELKLLSIYTNVTLTNGQKVSSVSSVYEMTTQSGRIIVSIRMDDQVGLNSFYLTPYERTDYYFTGTLNNLKDATGAQWGFLLLNVIAIGFTVFALVDCSRQKIKKKALWILLLLLGFVSLGATISSTSFRLNFNVGWITAYSALIRYGTGAVMLRLMLPVGTIIYFAMRRSLLKESTPAIVSSEKEPETMEEEIPSDQQPNSVLMDDQTEATTDTRQEQG